MQNLRRWWKKRKALARVPSMDDPYFCMMPWVTMHVWPSGKTFPCCLADIDGDIGDTQVQSLQEIWNSPKMRELRVNMMNGKPSAACERCYKFEKVGMPSLRTASKRFYKRHKHKVAQTTESGVAGRVEFAYLDIRFSNLCNLRCRTCSPTFSNSWYKDFTDLNGGVPLHEKDVSVKKDMNVFWKELEPLLDHIEEAYFAGGEPLISDEHHKIVEHWLKTGRTDVSMQYITNFTQIQFKGRNYFDVWKQFKDVLVRPSLDGSHARGEYLRKNLKWDDIVGHREEMIKTCPDVRFEITPTLSVFNVLHIPDFHREWVEKGYIGVHDITLNFLTDPESMSMQILPPEMKRQVREKYQQHIEWLKTFGKKQSAKPIAQYEAVLTHLFLEDKSDLIPAWLDKTQRLDAIRGENVFEVFPELEPLKAYANPSSSQLSV